MIIISATGNLGNNCKVEEVNGNKIIRFSIASNERYFDKKLQDTIKRTEWVNCTIWRYSDIANYLKKGAKVFIYGKAKINQYTNKDGIKVPCLNVSVQDIEIIKFSDQTNDNTNANKYKENEKQPEINFDNTGNDINKNEKNDIIEKDEDGFISFEETEDDLPF